MFLLNGICYLPRYSNLSVLMIIFYLQTLMFLFQKSSWLDIFLAELLAQIKEGKNVKDVLSFW